jgi:predicted DNA-binding transcriptional regulator YafY
MEGTNPTSRALQTLELLQIAPGITADRLGNRLGVSGRAAWRYVAILREAGIPVESTRGPYGVSRYAEQLAATPAQFRVVKGREVRDAVQSLGRRLLTATTNEPTARRHERQEKSRRTIWANQ